MSDCANTTKTKEILDQKQQETTYSGEAEQLGYMGKHNKNLGWTILDKSQRHEN